MTYFPVLDVAPVPIMIPLVLIPMFIFGVIVLTGWAVVKLVKKAIMRKRERDYEASKNSDKKSPPDDGD